MPAKSVVNVQCRSFAIGLLRVGYVRLYILGRLHFPYLLYQRKQHTIPVLFYLQRQCTPLHNKWWPRIVSFMEELLFFFYELKFFRCYSVHYIPSGSRYATFIHWVFLNEFIQKKKFLNENNSRYSTLQTFSGTREVTKISKLQHVNLPGNVTRLCLRQLLWKHQIFFRIKGDWSENELFLSTILKEI